MPYPLRSFFSAFVALVAFSAYTSAEPPKAVEAAGHFGALRFSGDEGWGGTGLAYGGTLTIPLGQRWAVEVDGVSAVDESFESIQGQNLGARERRTLFVGHIQYRRGTERVYWFIGAGPGIQHESRRGLGLFQMPSDPGPVLREFSSTSTNFAALGYKTGVVINPTAQLLIRGEVLLQHTYVLPDTMVRFGVGWRF